jgi:hypothetical protein
MWQTSLGARRRTCAG